MDAARHRELRELRARAYGPGADIHRDQAALVRLRELEALAQPTVTIADAAAQRPPQRVEPVAGTTALRDRSGRSPGIASTERTEAPDVPAEEAPARASTKPSCRTRVLWAASLVVTAAAAVAATLGLATFAPVAVSSGAPQIATLTPDASIDVPAGFMGAGPSSAVFEFHDLILIETAQGMGAGSDCLSAMSRDQLPQDEADANSWTVTGFVSGGCRVGPFPATVEMYVDSNAPQALRDRYPGGALQFVRDGDRVGVFLGAR